MDFNTLKDPYKRRAARRLLKQSNPSIISVALKPNVITGHTHAHIHNCGDLSLCKRKVLGLIWGILTAHLLALWQQCMTTDPCLEITAGKYQLS